MDGFLGKILRAAWHSLLPVRASLPRRYWRWTWAALAFRLLVGVPVFLVLVVPYWVMAVLVILIDELGGLIGGVYARCYNHDLKTSGWRPAPRLSDFPVIVRKGERGDQPA
jgi:hypothetical protein